MVDDLKRLRLEMKMKLKGLLLAVCTVSRSEFAVLPGITRIGCLHSRSAAHSADFQGAWTPHVVWSFLDGYARFGEPLAMPALPEPRLPARVAWGRQQPLLGELVLATGG